MKSVAPRGCRDRVKTQSSEEGHQNDRNSIQYRERSDRMLALNHRFKSSWDYRVPASGRFASGTILGGDTNRIIHASIAKFLATRRVVVLTQDTTNVVFTHSLKRGVNETTPFTSNGRVTGLKVNNFQGDPLPEREINWQTNRRHESQFLFPGAAQICSR